MIDSDQFRWSIIGHQNVVNYLQNCLKQGKIASAYLFVGQKQLGKAKVAEELAASLVCRNLHTKKGQIPCGECDCCRQVQAGLHPDVYWVTRQNNEKGDKLKKNISIEQIRELQNKLSLRSFLNSYKVAIIDEAETLSQAAANSLLKTLEEPTAKTVLMLLATNIITIPKTIVSRCQLLKFLPVDNKDIFEYLLELKIERKKAKLFTALSYGRPGLAIAYSLNQELFREHEEKTKQFLGLIKLDISERFKLVSELIDSGDIDLFKADLLLWLRLIRDLILIKYSSNLISNLNLSSELAAISDKYSSRQLINFSNKINAAVRYLDSNVNPKLVLENLVLNF
jgi:DNA polymerase-3 subunit delta'